MIYNVITHIHHPIIVPLFDLERLVIAVWPRHTSILLLHHHLWIVLSISTLHWHSLIRLTRRHYLGLVPISIVFLLVDLVAIAVLLLLLLLKLLLLLWSRHLLHLLLLLLHLHLS